MKVINCAVIDDEPIARKGLCEFISRIEFLSLKGCANDATSALQLLSEQTIDLIFLDIHMPGLSGIELIRQLTDRKPLFVFVTANPDHAVESYQLNSLDYLLKPVSFSRFSETAERAMTILSREPVPALKKDFFFVKSDGKLEKINIPSIVYISSLQNYVKIHLSSGRSHIVHSTLKNMCAQLDRERFIMVHKSYVVHVDYIGTITGNQISMTGYGNIPIGRLFRPNILPLILNS